MNVHFKSERMNWRTPKQFYEELNKEFHFDFDPCPSNPTFDGLDIIWGDRNFVNPPYGRELKRWVMKGYEQYRDYGKMSVFLIPARPDTQIWHDVILPKAKEVRFIKGRLKFDDQKNPAPFPSCLVIFRP